MAYLPIEDYGVIGDMRTAALVGKNGSIDWWCYPRFDSPSIFASVLDDDKGGRFQIHPTAEVERYSQFYWPETNVLVTRFVCKGGVGEIRDFMALDADESDDEHETRIVRQVVVVTGQVEFKMVCRPAFDYARAEHTVKITDRGAVFTTDGMHLSVSATAEIEAEDGAAVSVFTVQRGESVAFNLQESMDGGCFPAMDMGESDHCFERTVKYWRRWLSQCTYKGRWRDQVYRSALALKLMTYKPTGAIVAAPTMSLPEDVGGVRNWDYRYVWIRDAAFTLYGFIRIGFTEEADAFMGWLQARATEPDETQGPLQPLYGIGGEHRIEEFELYHLEGYEGSKPVRVGNAAYEQLQLDIYGELMDAVYLHNKYGSQVSYDFWTYLRPMLDWVCDNWQRTDESIWEPRGGGHHHVYSRLMCWVALDRGLRLSDKRSFPAPREKWLKHRDAIYEEIQEKGWKRGVKAFTQAYDVDALDASMLIMPLVFFMAPDDPRMLATIDAINRTPEDGGLVEDSLVYRYNPELAPDGLEGEEGTFNMCTFWLVEALTRAGRTDPKRMDEARLLFERMLGYSNHLDLYAEETGDRGQALGNFPQAFTHLALISAAFNLDRYLNE
ncbi:MAG: glycoside hydrolase family 15 protein [Chloroflexota bacterium]